MMRDGLRHLPDLELHRLAGYLRTSLRRFLIDCWRQRRWETRELPLSQLSTVEREVDPDAWAGAAEDPAELVLRSDEVARVWSTVGLLSEENRLLFTLAAEGWSHEELGRETRMKSSTVKQRLHSIRQQIQRRMER
jgi:RNA polymerase sigma factor (sigma-70 family)